MLECRQVAGFCDYCDELSSSITDNLLIGGIIVDFCVKTLLVICSSVCGQLLR
jgi:hypothetical protein